MENKRYHIVIGSVIFALLAWFSVNMRDDYTVVRYMPVVLENLKEGKALKYPVPKNVSVRFRGNGWSLAGLYVSPDVKYFIDLSNVGQENFIITGRDLLEHIKLPVDLQPLDVKPDTMLLALDDYKEKKIAVVPRFLLDYQDGYGQVGSLRLSPESVLIGGSAQAIEHITSWPTQYRKFEGLQSSIDMDLLLEEPPNYSVDVLTNSIRLQVNVQPFAEKTISGVVVKSSVTPPNREVIFIPPKMDIIVRGGIDQLSKLTSADFEAVVSYQSLLQDSAESVAPVLTAPGEVKVISKKPEEFQYIIRRKL